MTSFIEEQGGYSDDIFVGTHSSTLDCSICLKVMRDAVKSCKNSHYNCRSCLIKCKKCTVCGANIPKKKVFESAHLLRTQIGELDVRCVMNSSSDESHSRVKRPRLELPPTSSPIDLTGSDSCDWTGQLKDLEAHTSVCQYMQVECGFDGCDIRMQRRSLPDHQAVCDHRPAQCEICLAMIKYIVADKHREVCPKRPVPCPNNGCSQAIVFDQLSAHRALCSLQVINCQWKDVASCEYRCVRRDMAAHTSDASIHFTGMATKLLQMSEKMSSQSTVIAELQGKIHKCESENADLQESVNDLEMKVTSLEGDNSRLQREVVSLTEEFNRVEIFWEIPVLRSESEHKSSTFLAFGHTLQLVVCYEDDGIYGLYLCMNSRVPAQLYYKITVGRYDEEEDSKHVDVYQSEMGCLEDNGNFPLDDESCWQYAISTIFPETIADLLTLQGALQVKAVVYKDIPTRGW